MMIKEIKHLIKEGYNEIEISEKLEINVQKIRELIKEDKNKIKQKENKLKNQATELYDKSKNLNTTLQIEKINKEAWELYHKALENNSIPLASTILQTIMKQVELTSKKLGELNRKDDKNKLIPKDFIEYFMECLENENYFKTENEEKN